MVYLCDVYCLPNHQRIAYSLVYLHSIHCSREKFKMWCRESHSFSSDSNCAFLDNSWNASVDGRHPVIFSNIYICIYIYVCMYLYGSISDHRNFQHLGTLSASIFPTGKAISWTKCLRLIGGYCWWTKSYSQPPFGCIKPVLNNGINFNLNWLAVIKSITISNCWLLSGFLRQFQVLSRTLEDKQRWQNKKIPRRPPLCGRVCTALSCRAKETKDRREKQISWDDEMDAVGFAKAHCKKIWKDMNIKLNIPKVLISI